MPKKTKGKGSKKSKDDDFDEPRVKSGGGELSDKMKQLMMDVADEGDADGDKNVSTKSSDANVGKTATIKSNAERNGSTSEPAVVDKSTTSTGENRYIVHGTTAVPFDLAFPDVIVL